MDLHTGKNRLQLNAAVSDPDLGDSEKKAHEVPGAAEPDSADTRENFYASLPLPKQLTAKKILALDIDVDKVRWVVVKKSGGSIQVKKWGVQKFKSTDVERFRSLQIALENIRSKVHKQGMLVYASFFNPDINIRKVILPKLRKKSDLEKAILFQNQTDLPNFNEDYHWTYQILSEFEEDDTTKIEVLITVVSAEMVTRYLNVLEKSGFKPEKLIPRPTALASAYRNMVQSHQRDLLIDISYDFTQICYLNEGRLEYVRNIGIGAYNLELAIHNGNGNSNNQPDMRQLLGRELLEDDETPGNEIRKRLLKRVMELKKKQNPVLQMFLSEILRSIEFFKENGEGNNIDRLFITGYGINKESMLPYLRNRIRIPIFVLAPQFQPSDKRIFRFGEFSATIGTAFQSHKDFNLVPAEFRIKEFYRQLNMLIGVLFLFGGAFAGYLSYHQQQVIQQKERLLSFYSQEYEKLNPVERIYEDFVRQVEAVVKEKNSFASSVKPRPPIIETMKLFSNEVPEQIRLKSLFFGVYRQNKIGRSKQGAGAAELPAYRYQVNLSGNIQSDFLMGDVILINFINRLNELKFFKNIKLIQKEKNPKKKLMSFDLMLFL